MRFRRGVLREITGRLQQLGFASCPVCGGEDGLGADRRPVLLKVGGDPPDPDANTLFMVRYVCRLCGFTALFDSEQHHHGDEPTMFYGSYEEEDKQDPDVS